MLEKYCYKSTAINDFISDFTSGKKFATHFINVLSDKVWKNYVLKCNNQCLGIKIKIKQLTNEERSVLINLHKDCPAQRYIAKKFNKRQIKICKVTADYNKENRFIRKKRQGRPKTTTDSVDKRFYDSSNSGTF